MNLLKPKTYHFWKMYGNEIPLVKVDGQHSVILGDYNNTIRSNDSTIIGVNISLLETDSTLGPDAELQIHNRRFLEEIDNIRRELSEIKIMLIQILNGTH